MDSTPSCPLSRCILEGNTDTLKHLLCIRKKNPTTLQADRRGWTALHFAAFKDEHADCLKLLLSNKDTLGLNLDAKTRTGMTALFLACSEGCVKNCKILLENQCNADIPEMNIMYTPLHIASIRGHAAIVSQLIAHGSNPNCLDSHKKDTPLHCASECGNLDVVRVLMTSEETKINIRNRGGELPLHSASKNGSLEIVKILLEADHSQMNGGYDVDLALIIAVYFGRVECAKYLSAQGAKADHCTYDGKTILHFALESGVNEILEFVLQKISLSYIFQHFRREIGNFLSTKDDVYSLMSSAIISPSPECMLLLLESEIPKCILETPFVNHQFLDDVCHVYSPIAYLFRRACLIDQAFTGDTFDELLRLLLQYNITHLHEFRKMIEFKPPEAFTVRYDHPFAYIFRGPWSPMQRDRYLNMLFEGGITTDYSLQCDVHYNSRFQDVDAKVLERFYEPVVWAMDKDNAGFIELLLVNSAILEPTHLWSFLQYQISVKKKRIHPQNVINYLLDLGVVVNKSNLPLHPFGGTIKCPKLQQLCRQVIRKHLRDVTMRDNLKNFKQKINALPLPNLLKNFLQFK